GPFEMPEMVDRRPPDVHLAFSSDGKYLAYAPSNPKGGLQLFDGTTLRPLADLEPASSPRILATVFDPEGQRLWACQADGKVKAWSLADFSPEPESGWQVGGGGAAPLTAAQFDTSGRHLAVGDQEGRVRLFERRDREPFKTLEKVTKLDDSTNGRSAVTALAWSPDGKLIATGMDEGLVRVW